MKKILLIEDNEDMRSNTAEILTLSNYSVIEAENGKTGVEKALAHNPDLIICDIMMPVLDGYGVLHAVQQNELLRNTPFIFLTSKSDERDFRKGLELGADDYITKPFDGTDLLNSIYRRLKKMEFLKEGLLQNPERVSHPDASSVRIALQALVENRNINKYKKRQIIYSECNHPEKIYYVVKGKLKVYKTNHNGKVLVTDLFFPGDFIGYIAMFAKTVYQDTAETLEESELAVIPKEDFEQLVNNSREVSNTFLGILARNMASKDYMLLGMAYDSLRMKVGHTLIMLQEKFHEKKETKHIINMNRESMAAFAGVAKESLIRTLTDFRDEKIITINEGDITIINQKKLEQLIE